MLSMMAGRKTYLAALGLVLVGVGQWLSGDTDIIGLLQYLIASGAIAGLRDAIGARKAAGPGAMTGTNTHG